LHRGNAEVEEVEGRVRFELREAVVEQCRFGLAAGLLEQLREVEHRAGVVRLARQHMLEYLLGLGQVTMPAVHHGKRVVRGS
jgi:hypothetical protein